MCPLCVCVHVCPGCECEGLSVRRDVCVCVGEVVPNESPRSEGLSLTAANFT